MDNLQIRVFNNSSFKYLPRTKLIRVASKTLKSEKAKQADINFVFVDDKEIRKLNAKYLGHDCVTDVIAFPLEDRNNVIEGEVYIAVNVAKKNALDYGVSMQNEILRLAVHASLHLIGYSDKTESERKKMHDLENKYLK